MQARTGFAGGLGVTAETPPCDAARQRIAVGVGETMMLMLPDGGGGSCSVFVVLQQFDIGGEFEAWTAR